ncbi:uncharacterized protein LOC131948778 isoform X2 [Physella acuta]|uniref:uncharacterized protein LOC131948778 isoform X2 n=1 Tax=Physella acuta TaxID=109671 RepID=UPI0027DAEF5B|nr:uncharacterized protein LOC131948778 isoform X2 [Physella acuta]
MRLISLVCLLFLPVVLCKNESFVAIILGLERDCINYYCRYTGRLNGHFWQPYKILPPEVVIKPCVTLEIEYCFFDTLDECHEKEEFWMCPIWSFCPNYEYCNDQSMGYRCSCKKGSPYAFTVNVTRNGKLRINFYRLLFLSQAIGHPRIIVASSNIFDLRTTPDDWDPIELNGKKNLTFRTTNGNPPLRAGSMCVLMGTVFVTGLATLLFLSSFKDR